MIDIGHIETLPQHAPFVCLFSGGKDCNLALSLAMRSGSATALIHCVFDNDHKGYADYLNEKGQCEVVEKQASVLGLPITYHMGHWTNWSRLVKIYIKYRENGVKYVVFGDLKNAENVAFQAKLCKSAGLIPFFPLFNKPYDWVMNQIEEKNINAIISVVRSGKIPFNKYLGRIFDRSVYNEFKSLGIDPMGENGEFHTTVLFSDRYKRKLEYMITEKDERQIHLNIF